MLPNVSYLICRYNFSLKLECNYKIYYHYYNYNIDFFMRTCRLFVKMLLMGFIKKINKIASIIKNDK